MIANKSKNRKNVGGYLDYLVRHECIGDSEYRKRNNKECGKICCMDCEDDCICQCDIYMRETAYLGAKITKEQCLHLKEIA